MKNLAARLITSFILGVVTIFLFIAVVYFLTTWLPNFIYDLIGSDVGYLIVVAMLVGICVTPVFFIFLEANCGNCFYSSPIDGWDVYCYNDTSIESSKYTTYDLGGRKCISCQQAHSCPAFKHKWDITAYIGNENKFQRAKENK